MVNKFDNNSLLTPDAVMEHITGAYRGGRGLSVVRLGDGEALALAQDLVMPWEEVGKREFLQYAGLKVPNLKARDELAASIKKANIVGVAINPLPDFTPLLEKGFQAHGIEAEKMLLTNACINYFLLENNRLRNFLCQEPKPRVLLVGNVMQFLLPIFKREKIIVAGMIRPVNGVKDWERVAKLSRQYRFDIALVSAGIAAVMISQSIAESGKIAIDFGHAANEIGKRRYF